MALISHIYEKNIHDINIRIAHIPSVSLKKYADFNKSKGRLHACLSSDEEKSQQQKLLEKDIDSINAHISGLNFIYNKPSLRWDKQLLVFKSKKRGRNGKMKKVKLCNYHDLYDGVHANNQLKCIWYLNLFKSITMHPTNTTQTDTDSDSDHETWDFKRANFI